MQIKHLEYFRMLLLSLNIASTICVKNTEIVSEFNKFLLSFLSVTLFSSVDRPRKAGQLRKLS